jgi:hypothetical protein
MVFETVSAATESSHVDGLVMAVKVILPLVRRGQLKRERQLVR